MLAATGIREPENVKAFAVTHSTVSLIWDKAETADIAAYDIYQDGVKTGSSVLTKYQTVRTNYTVSGLKPDTAYKFSVTVRDAEGQVSRPCGEITVRTKPAGRVYNVKDYGAAGDGQSKDTAALQTAIEACGPGGIVLVPKGIYLTAPLSLKSDMTLVLAKGAVLLGSRNKDEYPVIMSRWEGLAFSSYQSIVTAMDAHNLTIMGEGVIDGNAGPGPDGQNCWWDKPKADDPETEIARPRTLQLIRCEKVLVQGITVQNSPSWTIHPLYSRDLIFADVAVNNPEGGPNTDGFDPDSVENLLMVNLVFNVGDDCVAIKSGRDAEGRKIGIPSTNIIIRNCLMRHGHGGISIGSEMSGGIKDVIVRDCVFDGTDIGVRIKTLRGRGGVIENLSFDSIVMQNIVIDAFNINTDYAMNGTPARPGPVTEETPAIRNIHFTNIQIEGAKEASYFKGLEEMPIEGLVFTNIRMQAEKGLYAENVRNVLMRHLAVNRGKIFQPGCSMERLAYGGILPGAVRFNGRDMAYVLPEGVLNGWAGTIETFFKMNSSQRGGPLFYGQQESPVLFYLRINDHGNLEFYRGSGKKGVKLVSPKAYKDRWHKVAAVWDGTGRHALYVDGQEVVAASLAMEGNTPVPFEKAYIGKNGFTNEYFQGEMKETAIYNYALSREQLVGTGLEIFSGGQAVVAGLFVNEKQYLDKGEVFTWVPTFLAGCSFVRTRAGSKKAISFSLHEPASVYVAYASAGPVPLWLESFQPTGKLLKNSADVCYAVYRKTYPQGPVVLGTCEGESPMYTVIVGPAAGPPEAGDVTLVQPVAAGVPVQGSYVYRDAEQTEEEDSSYRWLLADRRQGPYLPIPGAVSGTYTPSEQEFGRYLKFGVIPKNKRETGRETWSDGFLVKEYSPKITIAAPADGSVFAGRGQIEVEVTGDFPLARIELYADGQLLTCRPVSDQAGRYRLFMNAGDLPAGTHIFTAKAYNRFRGVGSSNSVGLVTMPEEKTVKTPVEDFYINAFSVQSNFGTSKTLDVRADSRGLDVWYADSIAYITFDVSGRQEGLHCAVLSLFGSFDQRQMGPGYANDGIFIYKETLPCDTFAAYQLQNPAVHYDEADVCFANMQDRNIGAKLSETTVFAMPLRYEWDVTAAVRQALAAGQNTVTVAVWADHDTDGSFRFRSRKETTRDGKGQTLAPQLKLYYKPEKR